MGLFTFLRKNKQQPGSEQSTYNSRSAEDTSAIRASRKRKNPGNETADPVLPEKKRARRRLVGAVALVLAVVIVLPMVLDSEPKPLADDIAIQIPSRDKPASASAAASGAVSVGNGLDQQEEIIDPASSPVSPPNSSANRTSSTPVLAAPNAVAPVAPAQASVTNANAAVTPTAQASVDIKPEPKPTPKAKPEAKPKTEAKEEKKHTPEPKAIVTAEDSPDVSDAEGTSDSARAAAILNGNTSAASRASTEKKSAKFIIQVAALASQEKVDELQGKLRDAGIRSYTQKIKTASGERIRIRVGPFNSKEEAEKARAKLAPLGLAGSLIPT